MSFPHGLVANLPARASHADLRVAGRVADHVDPVAAGGPERTQTVGPDHGEYLILTGIARFLVEFIRINPRILWGMTNAQLASLGAIGFGFGLIW